MEEEREKLQRDLERYHSLLRYTTDEAAIAAIKGLIRETRYHQPIIDDLERPWHGYSRSELSKSFADRR